MADIAKELVKQGYGCKRVKVMCTLTAHCGWQGRRVWRKEMFDKPCPCCKTVFRGGRTTVFCPWIQCMDCGARAGIGGDDEGPDVAAWNTRPDQPKMEEGVRCPDCQPEPAGELEGGSCQLAGPGRGDCEHFVGLPGKSIPNQHDGKDDTVDAYGKPNGWCWYCWLAYQNHNLRARLTAAEQKIGGLKKLISLASAYYENDEYYNMSQVFEQALTQEQEQ